MISFSKISFLQYFIGILATVWVILFLVFCLRAISLKYTPLIKSDAIVVLTGGSDHRIETGINLLKKNWAHTLFISGVNKIVRDKDLLKETDANLQSVIHLGYLAQNTHTNALEVSQWVEDNNIKSIILVTSFYHMPRSLLELKNAQPNLIVTPYSIFPQQFDNITTWLHQRYVWNLFLEYHKFWTIFLKQLIKG